MKKKNLSAKKKIHNFYLKKKNDPIIKKIYLNFKKKLTNHSVKNFCVSVSGGADSMALSFLAKCYSLEKKKKVFFYIVDHKFRNNSSQEAKLVKKKLKKYGISSEILTLKKVSKFSNLQSFARKKRYSLIFKESLNNKIDSVLTAHHSDDVLENFFIRLIRGSGLKGLASFGITKSKLKFDDKISILRPLIDIPKKDLIYICKNTFNFNVNDPSNNDDKYLRVKIRKLIKKLEEDGLTFSNFKKSLDNLIKSNLAIKFYVKKNINNYSSYLTISKTVILNENFLKQPDEIVFRSFSELIQKVGKRSFFARGVKVQNLINYIKSTDNFKKKTLSGCIIQKFENSVIISPENKKKT